MKRTIALAAILGFHACHHSANNGTPSQWQPDTKQFSQYSFVNDAGDFISNGYLHHIYDASFQLGGYRVDSACLVKEHYALPYDRVSIVTNLCRQLYRPDSSQCCALLKGKIRALDTVDRKQHAIDVFVPVVAPDLLAEILK